MSYHNSDNIVHITNDQLNSFLDQLGVSKTSYAGTNIFSKNKTFHLNGEKYTIKDTETHVAQREDQSDLSYGTTPWYDAFTFNLYDAIAVAKAANISDSAIASALQQTTISPPNGNVKWDEGVVRDFNRNTTASSKQIQAHLDKHYKNIDAHVSVVASPDGNGYITQISYTNSKGEKDYLTLGKVDAKELSASDFSKLLGESSDNGKTLDYTNANNSAQDTLKNANAQADYDLAQKVLDVTGGGGFKNAKTNNTLSEEDRASIIAALPSTENLDAWNQTKDSPVFNTLITNLQRDNPDLLKRIDYDTLKGISDTITAEQQSVTERDIKNQRAQLLQDIAKDPSLYAALVQQQRADNAAGTIAGQRAANTQAIASEADANYDKQADELYKNLFSGEKGNVAQRTYAENYGNSQSVLDTIIQGKLDDAVAKENLRASQIAEIGPMLQAIADATGIDVARFADAIAEEQAAAGEKAASLVSKVQGDFTTAEADNRANVQKVQDLFRDGASTVANASDGRADVTSAVDQYIAGIQTPVNSSSYTTVSAGDYEKAKQFANKQYSDLITSDEGKDFLNWILDSDTISDFTKKQTIEDFLTANGLNDMLTLEGLNSYYTKFNEEATKQSNKVFNQAQRAYIAAITAGDAKTADQLTRLATSAGASKKNLFAASALANQFKQQTGLSKNGRQLATDFLNQQSFNRSNTAQAGLDAATAQLKYLGSGDQQSSGATLYEAFNKHHQNAADATKAYGSFGSSIMGSNQDMSSWSVKNNIDNWNRLVDVSKDYTAANAAGAAANTSAQGAIETLRAQALAKQAQALKTNPNLKQ